MSHKHRLRRLGSHCIRIAEPTYQLSRDEPVTFDVRVNGIRLKCEVWVGLASLDDLARHRPM